MEVSLRNHTPKNGLKILEVARKDIKIESTNYPSKREVDTFYVGKVSKDRSRPFREIQNRVHSYSDSLIPPNPIDLY